MLRPKYATRRRPERPNLLFECQITAQLLGWELMPWQEEWLATLTEYSPDDDPWGTGFGTFWYDEGVCTVPRQSGKTTIVLVHVLTLQRIGLWHGFVWTGANGRAIVRKWKREIWPHLDKSELSWLFKNFRRSNGEEGLEHHSGAFIDLLGSSKDAGHGDSLDGYFLDEFWVDNDDQREAGLSPTLITRPYAQALAVSTAGTQASTLYLEKTRRGRRAVGEDRGEGLCYLEYGAPDEGWDPDDEDSWWTFMPALGHTIDVKKIRSEREKLRNKPGEFERAYGNIVQRFGDFDVDPNLWLMCQDNSIELDPSTTSFAVDVAHDRSFAAITAADSEGRCVLIDHKEGTGWIVDAAARLVKVHGAKVYYDVSGPAAAVEGLSSVDGATELSPREMMRACGGFFDAISQAACRVRTDTALDLAIEGAERRKMGDGFVWDRRGSRKPVEPLVSLSMAYFGAKQAGPQAFVV